MAISSSPFFAPALLVVLGYMDPVKWVTAIEGGCRYGFELLWVLILSNFVDFLLHYLSAMLGWVTGKNLAEICRDEYPQSVCFLLWIQLEISVVLLDTIMILCIAAGLNFVLGLSFVPCIFISEAVTLFFLTILPQVGMNRMEVFTASVMSCVLLCFVTDTLYAHATISAAVFGIFPRLKGESLYTALSIFGANLSPANLYMHSRFIQEKRKVQCSTHWSLFRNILVDSGFAFSVAFVVNFAVLSSAAVIFHNSGLVIISLQDAHALIEQVLQNSVAPAAFMLAFFCTSQFSSFTRIVAGKIALEGFIGVTVVPSKHQLFIKMIAFLAALLCVWTSGSEVIYQIIVFSQVILAMQLPFALVPLIKATSSHVLMGEFKNSFLMEVFTWVVVALMSIMNVWLVFDMLFGETDEWIGSQSWNFISDFGGSSTIWGKIVHMLVFLCIILVAVFSTGLVIWMMSKPLKTDAKLNTSATDRSTGPLAKFDEPKVQESSSNDEEFMESFINSICEINHGKKSLEIEQLDTEEKLDEVHISDTEQMLSKEDKAKSDAHSGLDLADKISFSEHVESSENVQEQNINMIEGLSTDSISYTKSSSVLKGAVVDVDGKHLNIDGWENLEVDVVPDSVKTSFNSIAFEESISERNIGAKCDASEDSGFGSGSGNLSRLSGLGRAARRQFAGMLDEFWGKLFDLHGQPISQQEKLSLPKHLNSDRGQGVLMKESFWKDNYSYKGLKPSWQKESPSDQMLSHMQNNSYATLPSLSRFGNHPVDAYNVSERRYLTLHFPLYHEEKYQQPVTVHGYKSASYLNRFGTPHLELDKRRLPNTERKLNSLPSVGAGLNQSFSFDTTYRMPSTVIPMNSHLSQQKYDGQTHSYFSSYKQNSDPLDKWQGMHPETHVSSHVTSSHEASTSVRMDGEAWNPLVYRATGELDVQEINVGASNSNSNNLGFSLPHSPISRRGIGVRTVGDVQHIKNQNEITPLSFDELSPSQLRKDGFSIQSSQAKNQSLWARQPFEQLFGPLQGSVSNLHPSHWTTNYSKTMEMHGIDREREVLNEMRSCIVKLLRLDGFDWLFRLDTGSDEDLVALIARREAVLIEAEVLTSQTLNIADPFSSGNGETSKSFTSNEAVLVGFQSTGVPHCGLGCIWHSELLISFGVWCIHRILELSLMESRPELWGKYTYVLNRLQGILDPAFSKPRATPAPCLCVQTDFDSQGSIHGIISNDTTNMAIRNLSNRPPLKLFKWLSHSWLWNHTTINNGKCASASAFIETIREVEAAISTRKGRTGTAAGDVAFPKGKENLASVLKRYKRRLGNKLPGALKG